MPCGLEEGRSSFVLDGVEGLNGLLIFTISEDYEDSELGLLDKSRILNYENVSNFKIVKL